MNISPDDAAISAPRILRLARPACRVLPLAMLFGASLGTLAGSRIFPPVPESVASLANAATCFIAVFLSAVLFGFLLLPILFLFRGFLLSYSVSVLLAGGVPAGRACLIVGLPALFSLTALFLLGEEAFCSSLDIYRTCRGYPTVRFSFVSADRLLIAALLVSAAAFVRQLLIPLLL